MQAAADAFAGVEETEIRVAKIWLPRKFRKWLESDGKRHLSQDGRLWGAKLRTLRSGSFVEAEGEDFIDLRRRPKRSLRGTLHRAQP
jgi:hypothetical protein